MTCKKCGGTGLIDNMYCCDCMIKKHPNMPETCLDMYKISYLNKESGKYFEDHYSDELIAIEAAKTLNTNGWLEVKVFQLEKEGWKIIQNLP